MAETLGEKLKAAREARGISVSQVAEQTRIASMYIECIENDNYKPLPGGIFNKGFVKSYARFIGYDEQEALQEYGQIATQAEGTQEDHFRSYRPEVLTDDRASQSTVPTIIFAGIILALMTGGILFLVSYLQSSPSEPVAVNNAVTNQNQSAVVEPTAIPAQSGDMPTMQNLRVEFRTTSSPISLSATSDGKNSVNTVTASAPQTFEPRESIRLSYAKSLASNAQLFINGKQITLPSQPTNPKRIPIEVEINASNLAQIWSSGAISFGTAAVSTPQPAQPSATPSQGNTSTATIPRAATPTPRTSPAVANRLRATPTPIIVGGNRNATRRPPN